MSKDGMLIIAISVLVILLIIFIISFTVYTLTPPPKGCENIKISEENCSKCGNKECSFYKEKSEE